MANSVEIRNLDLSFGSIEVLKDLNLQVAEGEFLVLLGSSGCGKSTLLNCIAGLLEVTAGQLFIKSKNVTWAEPSDRGIGMVFQSYALYPQMSVKGNLSFGLKNAKVPKAEIEERVAKAAEILQIGPLLNRKPSALSGGQRQRVAIGRALVRDVEVFLFDEPLSNLDAKLRVDLRIEIKRLHQQLKNTMIYVTHDQIEAMTLADRIAIMRDGKIMQLGSPAEIYDYPMNKYVADFIGSPSMNFIKGEIKDQCFTVGDHKISVKGYATEASLTEGQQTWIGIRPEHVVLGEAVKKADYKATITADIVEPMGADTLVWTEFAGQPFRIRLNGKFPVASGQELPIGINASTVSLFDLESEERL